MTFDPKIGWAILIAIALEAVGGLLWTGQAAARLTAVEQRQVAFDPTAERLARLEAQLAEARITLGRIEDRLERQEDAR